MRKLTTVLVLLCFASAFGQLEMQHIDKNAPFFVNPNPHPHSSGSYTDVILEDTVGLNQNGFSAGPRSRGNLFTCTTDRTLIEFLGYHNPTVATQMWFCVYEGATQAGIYNLIDAQDVSPQGPGEGWYSSGAINVDLLAGMYYMMFVSFEQATGYWNENPVAPYPIPVSFGELTAGAGWNYAPTSNFPPDATQDVPATAFADPVAYYQILITDDPIPVELTSFAANVGDGNVTLNWTTATETNNQGFDVERNVGNGFEKIGFVAGFGTSTEAHTYSYVDGSLEVGSYTYRLKQIDYDGTTEYSQNVEVEVIAPDVFALEQNYPNPFNPSTMIKFSLAADSKVSLTVFDVLGQEVANLISGNLAAGSHEINFNASNVNSGVYFYRIDATAVDGTNFSSVKKMILTK